MDVRVSSSVAFAVRFEGVQDQTLQCSRAKVNTEAEDCGTGIDTCVATQRKMSFI